MDIATRSDVNDVRRELFDVCKELSLEIADVRKELSSEIAIVRKDMELMQKNLIMKLGSIMVGTVSLALAIVGLLSKFS